MKKFYVLIIACVIVVFLIFIFSSNSTQTISQAPGEVINPVIATSTDDATADDTGSATSGADILTTDSGVEGMVTLGPTCPVAQIASDPDCADKPYSVLINVIASGSSDNSVYQSTLSGADGKYKIMLPPGDYTLDPDSGSVLPQCQSKAVTVNASQFTEVNLVCDTGIR